MMLRLLPKWCERARAALRTAFALVVSAAVSADDLSDRISIHSRDKLPAPPVPCQRVALGKPDDYKPCIARLPGGELLLTAFHQEQRDDNKVMEQTLLFRSQDGG